jgi:hypothetical protein
VEWPESECFNDRRCRTARDLAILCCPMPASPSTTDCRDILSAPDALARLATAREHLEQAFLVLGNVPSAHGAPHDPSLADFGGAVSWHEHMQEVLEVVRVAGRHGMSEEQMATVSRTMTRMRAVLALAEPFDAAAARLRNACLDLQDQVYGPIWECEDQLRMLAHDDPALADRLRKVGLLPESDLETPNASRPS